MSLATTDSYLTDESEAEFLPEELFFSRTDERGVIRFGNDVFQRVAGYTWDELDGAPHKIIRHPDMPRAVFWLIWETLKSGAPVGGYVKNRAKNGDMYWVYAIITPITGGYLSVRLKPLSELMGAVKGVYEAALAREAEAQLSPEESAAQMVAHIQSLGFKDYATFMAHALSREVSARDVAIERPQTDALTRYHTMLDALIRIQASTDNIVSGFASIKTSPVNMGVVSAQMGEAALPLSVIAQSFGIMIADIRAGITAFVARADKVSAEIHQGLFVTCANLIQSEVTETFHTDSKDSILAVEGPYLAELEERYVENGLSLMVDEVTNFHTSCKRLMRTLSGLSVTSIIGQIESARIGRQGTGIDDIMRQLDVFQQVTRDALTQIQDDSHVLLDALERETCAARANVTPSAERRRA